MTEGTRVVVLGGGPAGDVAALRAELCRAQGGDVAGWATAQHDDPKAIGHSVS